MISNGEALREKKRHKGAEQVESVPVCKGMNPGTLCDHEKYYVVYCKEIGYCLDQRLNYSQEMHVEEIGQLLCLRSMARFLL